MASSSRIFEYFVVCGLGPEIRALDGAKGFHGADDMYMPAFLDQFPPSNHALYPPPPPQLPTCVLPAGVRIYSSGLDANDVSTYPRSYPIVLTEGDGSKIYVSCIAFRDPICEDITEAYQILANSFADKCICLVSHSPSFQVLRDALEEIFVLCFSPAGCSEPLWDIISHVVSNVPLPTPGKDRVLFAIENCLLFVEAPPKEWLPHADISFQPLVQCLDVDKLIQLFTAVLLERRILLRSNKYTLLTLVSEAICHLIYPIRWQHVYIPIIFSSGVDYIDAPTPYMMGLHSGVDTSTVTMDGVVVVDLEYNRITTSEEIPPIPENEHSFLRGEILKLLQPNVMGIDYMKINLGSMGDHSLRTGTKSWGQEHDFQLRLIFFRFFAQIMSGYHNFIDNASPSGFNSQAFLKKRSRATNQPVESMSMIMQFLETQGFLDYLERCNNAEEISNNLLDKLQDATVRGQSPLAIFPSQVSDPEIITIADSETGGSEPGSRHCYKRFPANARTEEQEEKRKSILALASGASKQVPSSPSVRINGGPKAESLSPRERAAERERMVLDIKVKLQGLWLRLLRLGATEDPLSSFEYGTILALIESDAEGIGGSGFVECIREHIHSGWQCRLTDEQFIAVKELLKTAITLANSRNDMPTIRDALEVSAEIYRKDPNNVQDYVQRHLLSLSVWDELRFWDGYFEYLMENCSNKSTNYVTLVTAQLIVMATHMAGLGLPDVDSWNMIEKMAERNNLGYKQLIKLRALLMHLQQLRVGYWGITAGKGQPLPSYGMASPHAHDVCDESQQPAEASGLGRSWVQSMFSRDRSLRASSFNRANDAKTGATAVKTDLSAAQKKTQTNMRTLRGHTGAITALHCVTRKEVWDLVGDREDAGFFISGSTDCTVKIWDPSLRGSELRATLKGHTRTIRAISSDRGKIVSGADDQSVIVWDKQTFKLLEELKGHEAPVSSVWMLSGERVLTASHDGTVKMWDVRTDTCVATVGRCQSAVLCMEYDDSTGILAAAGRDVVAHVWDIRSGKQMFKLQGHSKWIRSMRMTGETIITGSDDWTARVWSLTRGTCDAVLACHAGPILCVEYSPSDKGIITGSSDGLIRFWENEGGIRCVKNLTLHSTSVLSISAGDHWLGIGAADNSMSLFHRPQERFGGFSNTGSKVAGWQLYRTPQKTAAVVRCIASDLDRKRICSGGRNGLLRLWDATTRLIALPCNPARYCSGFVKPVVLYETSPILDLTIVGFDIVDDDSNSHGQQPHFLKTCLNPSLDLGSTVLLLGHTNGKDLAVGEGKVVIATDNLIKFSTDEVLWRPGSAGFDMHGNLAFMVCDPMKLVPFTPTGYASASSTALLASNKDVPTQFGIPIPAVCVWLKQHWSGSLEDVSKPMMPPARLISAGQRSERSSLGHIHYIKTMEREGSDVSSSSQISPRPTWQHGSCSSASAKILYGENDYVNSHSFHEQRDPNSQMSEPKNGQPASLMDISFPPGHPRSMCLPLPLKQMMSDENKMKPNCSVSHESRLGNVQINCETLHNVAYQEYCWSEVQSSSSPLEISELGDERDGFSSGEETMYSAETRESRNIPSPKEKRPEIVGRSQSFVNHSKWDSPNSVGSSKGVPSKSRTFIPLRKPHLQAAAISQKSQDYFSHTVSSNMKKRNLSQIPMKPRQSAQVTSKWTI